MIETSLRVGIGEDASSEPVVKSWKRVPTPMTRSAAAQASLPQAEPVTPGEPKFIGCSQLSAPLPAWVSTKGMLRRFGEVGEQVLGAGVEDAAAGDDHRGLARARMAATTSATSTGSGSGRRMRQTFGSKKLSG